MVMRRAGSRAQAAAAIVFGALLVIGGVVPKAAAVTPDPSDVVLVLDFSASILRDGANRNRFGAALERIADRVDATAADLTAGDATVSIVQFASRASDVPGCADLKLLQSPAAVAKFADCLRSVARAYRKGSTSALTKKIGVDTNYVAAMDRAASHLPANSVRPALILFTDGKHDVKGVPVSRVLPARDRLFGGRSPFALLPVGMGLDPLKRNVLETGLEQLRVIRDMPACVSGDTFDWPDVVFETADKAGNAVAVALQEATCTFTVAPTPTPSPSPVPPTPAPVVGVELTPGDGRIELTWSAPTATKVPPATDYQVQCRTGGGKWVQSSEGVSLDRKASIEGLVNGSEYECQIAAVGASTIGAWTPAGKVTPLGRPAPPAKPTVTAANQALRIDVPAASAGVDRFTFECSGDQGATWPAKIDASAGSEVAQVGLLTNGVEYVCRAFAANDIGVSEASVMSDAATPCGSTLECNRVLVPVLGGLLVLLFGGIAAALFALLRGRTRGHVVAVVDVVHTANVGHGSRLGIAFVREGGGRAISGIVAERGPTAEIRIRRLQGEKFEVRDRNGKREVPDGDTTVITDSLGVRHSLVLRAFATNAASRVATRR
ncbi:MAG: fibronectin type III domain-containing protein [Chloroflexi bacterium]|nr:fibronectin type III domain-containing protein [Chloroflexota bacterium]